MASCKISFFLRWDTAEGKPGSCRGPRRAVLLTGSPGADPQLEKPASLQALVKTIYCNCRVILQHSGFRRWSLTVWSKPIKSIFDAVLMPGAIISQSLTTTPVFDLSRCERFAEDFNQWPPGQRCCSRVVFFPLCSTSSADCRCLKDICHWWKKQILRRSVNLKKWRKRQPVQPPPAQPKLGHMVDPWTCRQKRAAFTFQMPYCFLHSAINFVPQSG